MFTIFTTIALIWYFLGMQSYIFWINRYNTAKHKKWRKRQVNLIPFIGILGIFNFVIGAIIISNKTHDRYNH